MAISVKLDGSDAPAHDLTTAAQLLVPGDNSAPFTSGVGGGPVYAGTGGGRLWLTGGNMVQHGVGGASDGQFAGGFGWGSGGALTCQYRGSRLRSGSGYGWDNGVGVSSGSDGKFETPAHVVSSALVSCDPPVLVEEYEDDEQGGDAAAAGVVRRYPMGKLSGAAAAAAVEGGDLAGVIVSAWVSSGGSGAAINSGNSSAVALRVVPVPRYTSLSPRRGEGLPSAGGAVVSITWQMGAVSSGGRGGGGGSWGVHYEQAVRGGRAPAQLACAFGTMAPVAMSIHGGGRGGGSCVSPAHSSTPRRRGDPTSVVPVWLHLPNTGRLSSSHPSTSYIDQSEAISSRSQSIRSSELGLGFYVDATSAWTLLPSATSSGGGGALVLAGAIPHAVATCVFGLETSSSLHQLTGEKMLCYGVVLRGGFTAVRLPTAGGTFAGSNVHYKGGASFALELYVSPIARSVAPPWAPTGGGTLHAVRGSNLRPAHDHGGQPELACVVGQHAGAAMVVSSVLARCEAPARATAFGTQVEDGDNDDADVSVGHNLPLTVVRGGDAAATSGVTLHFTARPRVFSSHPAAATADFGGTVVAVLGSGFRDGVGGAARCSFGTVTVSAAVQNGTRIECVAPAHIAASVHPEPYILNPEP